MSKDKVSTEIFMLLENIDCAECPLRKACDLVEDNDMGSICGILDKESN